jgi:hypothetical protein
MSTVLTADTCVTRETDHPLGQSMATEQKVQHVDGRDVVLDLNPLLRTVVQVCPGLQSSSYSFMLQDILVDSSRLVELIVDGRYKVLGMGVGVQGTFRIREGLSADYGSPRRPWGPGARLVRRHGQTVSIPPLIKYRLTRG